MDPMGTVLIACRREHEWSAIAGTLVNDHGLITAVITRVSASRAGGIVGGLLVGGARDRATC